MTLATHFEELIRRASTQLPPDVRQALVAAAEREGESTAGSTIRQMLANAAQARDASSPICQDTGTPIFYVTYGPDYRQKTIEQAIREAAGAATRKYYLRPNSVDSVTGRNSGDNTGLGFPYIHFREKDDPGIDVRLMLKGGGSENVGAQYSLPDDDLGAGRDIEGIRRCVLCAVYSAQGEGCAPGTLGVGIGGDRMSSYMESKEQLFRRLCDTNPDPQLAALEARLYEEANTLGIGPMGTGGKTTVLGVKIGKRHRLPASFFVSVSYICWAFRRAAMTISGEEVLYDAR